LLVHLDCLSTRASAAPRRVCLQLLLCAPKVSANYLEHVLHYMRIRLLYKSFVLHLEVSIFKSLCCTCESLSTRALCCTCACLCCTWTCLPTRVQCMVYLEEHSLQTFFCLFRFSRNRFVCFGCFDMCSKHRNKPKNRFFWFHETNRKTTETDCVSVLFGSNRKYFLFVSRTPYCTVSLVLAVIYLFDGCLPNICRTGLDPGRCLSPVGRRSRQLLAPAAVTAVAAVAAAAGPAASRAAATSVFGENVAQSRQKKVRREKNPRNCS
jgi:hypothetical protein